MPKVIEAFKNEYRFLSNFAPVNVYLDGIGYPTVEHAYQAAKTLDPTWRSSVRNARTPQEARSIGRRGPPRPGWGDELRLKVMRGLLQQKFMQSPYKEQLLGTGDAILIEGNWWGDTFWGVDGTEGENHLGKLLMEIRSEISAER